MAIYHNDICVAGSTASMLTDTTNTGFSDSDSRIPSSKLVDTKKQDKSKLDTTTTGLTNDDSKYPSSKLLSSIIDTRENANFVGLPGEVLYATPSGLKKQTILDMNYFVCETDEDIEKSKSDNFSFKEVFDNWIKGGMYGNVSTNKVYGYDKDYPTLLSGGIKSVYNETTAPKYSLILHEAPTTSWNKNVDDYGYAYWTYNDEISSIIEPVNTWDLSFYISPINYKQFDITVRCYSVHGDNDTIGLIAAANDGDDGKLHTLSFERCFCADKSIKDASWYAAYDKNAFGVAALKLIMKKSSALTATYLDGSTITEDQLSATSTWNTWTWRTCSAGTLIRIRRDDNMISAWTSPFTKIGTKETIALAAGSMITIDLNSDDKYKPFRNGAKVGFCTFSLPYSTYEIIDFSIPKTIINTLLNDLSTYNPLTKAWVRDNTLLPVDVVGIGRLTKNISTNKTFYVNKNTFTKISLY